MRRQRKVLPTTDPIKVLTAFEEHNVKRLFLEMAEKRKEIRAIMTPKLLQDPYGDGQQRLTWALERRTYVGFVKYLRRWLSYLF